MVLFESLEYYELFQYHIYPYVNIQMYDKNKQYLLNNKYNNEASERLYMQLTDVDKITLNNLSPLDNLFYTLAKRRK